MQGLFHHFQQGLEDTVLQEISDKMHTLHKHLQSDGKGLSGGHVMENILFEILHKNLKEFSCPHEGQSDCEIVGMRLSFKKITGKSSIALNWSKNPGPQKCILFECPILLLNLKEGKWWRKNKEMDRFIPSGFFFIDHEFCNQNVRLKSNNKTNTLIDDKNLYHMLTHAMDQNLVLELPPPSTDRYGYSFNEGFYENTSKTIWPHLGPVPDRLRFIDIFAGVGGFHYALSSLGAQCVFAADIDEHCRSNYFKNFGIQPAGDIRSVHEQDIPPFDILCGGFPCQPFSKAGDQNGFKDKTKGNVFFEIIRILRYHQPTYFILENVKNIVGHDKGRTWGTIRQHLQDCGYIVTTNPIPLSPLQLGTPQSRERAFIMGRLANVDASPLPSFPKIPNMKTCISKVLSQDPSETHPYKLAGKHHEAGMIWEQFCTLLTSNDITIPRFPIWTEDWDRSLPEDDDHYKKYKNWIDKNKAFYGKHKEILHPWLMASRNNPAWTGCLRKLEWQCDETSLRQCLWTFRGSGVRVRDLDYSPTLVAMAMVPVYGPEWRKLTPREVCRLQDFPETYHYHPKECYKQMGNAVNVRVARYAATWLLGKE